MNQHKAIIKGQVLRRVYCPYPHPKYDLEGFRKREWKKLKETVFVEWKTIWEGDINMPLLERGEVFYIDELELKVAIKERMRTSSGNYIYETKHIVELLNDDQTRKSEIEADAEVELKNEEEKRLVEKMELRVKEVKKNWIKRLFKI